MKTGFLFGYPNKPVKEYYGYHGETRDCLIQPEPGSFDDYDNLPPYGPEEYIKLPNQLQYSLWCGYFSYDQVWNYHRSFGTCDTIGQNIQLGGRYVRIYRHYVSFATNVIDPSWSITKAKIYVRTQHVEGDGGRSMILQAGVGERPLWPRQYTNYNKIQYYGNLGSVDVSHGASMIYWLTGGNLGLIKKGGRTAFAIRSIDDINGDPRSGLNYVATLIGSSYQYLELWYKRPL